MSLGSPVGNDGLHFFILDSMGFAVNRVYLFLEEFCRVFYVNEGTENLVGICGHTIPSGPNASSPKI